MFCCNSLCRSILSQLKGVWTKFHPKDLSKAKRDCCMRGKAQCVDFYSHNDQYKSNLKIWFFRHFLFCEYFCLILAIFWSFLRTCLSKNWKPKQILLDANMFTLKNNFQGKSTRKRKKETKFSWFMKITLLSIFELWH